MVLEYISCLQNTITMNILIVTVTVDDGKRLAGINLTPNIHPLKHNLNPLTSLVNNENACHLTEAAQCLKFNNHLASSRDARKAIFDKQCL